MRSRELPVRQVGLAALHYSGIARAFAPLTGGLGAILMLHRVVTGPPAAFEPNRILRIRPEFLEFVIRYVRTAGYDVVSLDEARARLRGDSDPRRFVCFTFDDGYRDNLEVAYPIFRREGLPLAIYVPSDYADGRGDLWWLALELAIARLDRLEAEWDGLARGLPARTDVEKNATFDALYWRLRAAPEADARAYVRRLCAAAGVDTAALGRELMMTWDDIRRLDSDELVTIGAHTRAHFALAKLTTAEARREIVEGADRIQQEIGVRPRHFSYPYGDEASAGPREFQLVDELGFATGVTTRKGLLKLSHGSRLTALPRLSLNGDFQRPSYLRPLLSGLPFALAGAAGSLARGRRRSE
jgi:peptidoglycan/xylan/chitin deacetylase (PgdA/CDA1 family)